MEPKKTKINLPYPLVPFPKPSSEIQSKDWWLPEAREWEVGAICEVSQKAQNSSYKISRDDVMYHMVTIVNNTVLHI